jgi:hypothetical protein
MSTETAVWTRYGPREHYVRFYRKPTGPLMSALDALAQQYTLTHTERLNMAAQAQNVAQFGQMQAGMGAGSPLFGGLFGNLF